MTDGRAGAAWLYLDAQVTQGLLKQPRAVRSDLMQQERRLFGDPVHGGIRRREDLELSIQDSKTDESREMVDRLALCGYRSNQDIWIRVLGIDEFGTDLQQVRIVHGIGGVSKIENAEAEVTEIRVTADLPQMMEQVGGRYRSEETGPNATQLPDHFHRHMPFPVTPSLAVRSLPPVRHAEQGPDCGRVAVRAGATQGFVCVACECRPQVLQT